MSCSQPTTARAPLRVRVLATGGTIEKTYDAAAGGLALGEPVIEALVAALVLSDMDVRIERLMAVDSLDMSAAERKRIVEVAAARVAEHEIDAVVITHGTDTLADTARALVAALDAPARPIVLTGAMRPWQMRGSDAAQNVAQALLACRLLAPGVYAVFHGRVLAGEYVEKNRERGTFVERRVDRAS